MYIKNKHKKIISTFISLVILLQLIPGISNIEFSLANSDIRIMDRMDMLPEDDGLLKLEVLRDTEGNAEISEDTITWKIIYNIDKQSLGEQSLELFLPEDVNLKYIDGQDSLDLDRQPLFDDELFEQYNSEVNDGSFVEYGVLDENRNNKDFIKSFYKSNGMFYVVELSETDETQEIIFTTSLSDKDSNEFYSYVLYKGTDTEEDIEIKSSAEVKLKPSTNEDSTESTELENSSKRTENPDNNEVEKDVDLEKEAEAKEELEGKTKELVFSEAMDKSIVDKSIGNTETLGYRAFLQEFSIMNMSLTATSTLPPEGTTGNYLKIIVTYPEDPSNPDSRKIPLPGARFSLKPDGKNGGNPNQRVALEGTTDDAGILFFKNIPIPLYNNIYETFELVQLQAPFGYEKDSTVREIKFLKSSARMRIEEYTNIKNEEENISNINLDTIMPEYEKSLSGIDAGTFSAPYHQEDGVSVEEKLYRNRDNIDDARHSEYGYSVPMYSKYKFGSDIDMSIDRDVIENQSAYLWKTATPTENPGEYFIDLVVEGKSRRTTDLILVLDSSGSMSHKSPNNVSRMDNLKEGVDGFLDDLDLGPGSGVRVGIVDYAGSIKDFKELGTSKAELKSFVNSMEAAGGTFTQLGLMKANELLRDSTADDKAIVLISDGSPTMSFRVNNFSKNSSIDSLGNIGQNGEHLGPRDYGNTYLMSVNEKTASPVTIFGDGRYYGLHSSGTTNNRPYRVYYDDTEESKVIDNHGVATVSESKSLKNHGVEIYSLAVEAEGIGTVTPYMPGSSENTNTDIMTGILRDISTGDDHYFKIDSADDIGQVLLNIKPITDKTVMNGSIQDPIASQIILGKSEDGGFKKSTNENLTDGNYHILASGSYLYSNIDLNKDENDKITLSGFTLGESEWVKLRYKVNLRTELDGEGNVQDPGFEEKFYLTSKEDTTFTPDINSDEVYAFGVPAIRLNNISVEITKNWIGFEDDQIIESADFLLEKSIDGENWIEVDTITLTKPEEPENLRKWNTKVENLIRFDNQGNKYQYRISEVTTGDFDTEIETVEHEDGSYSFTANNTRWIRTTITVQNLDKYTNRNLKNTEYKLYKDQELTEIIGTEVTDENGIAKFENILDGIYYLKEASPSDSYDKIDSAIKIVINNGIITIEDDTDGRWKWIEPDGTENPINLKVFSEKLSDLTLEKVDNEQIHITVDTAVFEIYKETDFVKDENTGKITINDGAVPVAIAETEEATGIVTTEKIFTPGAYALVEKKHPHGYIGLLEPVSINFGYIDYSDSYEWFVDSSEDVFVHPYTKTVFVMNRPLIYPDTGGTGGIIFAAVGIFFMVAAYIMSKKAKVKII